MEINVKLTESQARLIIFSLIDSIKSYDNTIESLQKQDTSKFNEQELKMYNESLLGLYNITREMTEIKDKLTEREDD